MDGIFDGLFTGVSVLILAGILLVALIAYGIFWAFKRVVTWRER